MTPIDSKQRKIFPLKYKLFMLLVLLPILSISIFFWVAKGLFERDKMAYVNSTGLSHTKELGEKIRNALQFYNYNIDLILDGFSLQQKQFDQVSTKIFDFHKQILQIEIFNKSKAGSYSTTFSLNKKNYKSPELKFNLNILETQLETTPYILKIINSDEFILISKKLTKTSGKNFIVITHIKSESMFDDFYKQNIFFAKLIDKNGHIIISDGKIDKVLAKNEFLKKVIEKNLRSGTIEIQLTPKKVYLISYYSIGFGDLYVFSFLEKKLAMTTVEDLVHKSIILFIAVISFSLFISLFASRRLTENLNAIYEGTQRLKQGVFDIAIKIKSNDESGHLADSFNIMSEEIHRLLSKLEEHNRNLEKTVEERTKELREAHTLQQAMVNSLNQGFFIFNEDGIIHSIQTSIAEKMFEISLDGQFIGDILKLPEKELSSLRKYCKLLISNKMPFKDLIKAMPQQFINSKDQIFDLEYFPITNEKNKITDVVFVATDKTKEVKALKAAEDERNYIGFLLKFLRNKQLFLEFSEDINALIHYIAKLNWPLTPEDSKTLLIQAHNLKANAAAFFLSKIQHVLHTIEDMLINPKLFNVDSLMRNMQELKFELKNTHKDLKKTFSYDTNNESLVTISYNSILEFQERIKNELSPEDQSFYKKEFCLVSPERNIKELEEVLNHSSHILGKQVHPLKVEISESLKIHPFKYNELFSSLNHFINNILDHGIEEPDERLRLKKDKLAQVKFKIHQRENSLHLILTDDGRGIDIDLLKKKVVESFPDIDLNSLSDSQILQYIFEPQISTSQRVSLLSGRGVGMSVIKDNVEALDGSINISSTRGKGTTLEISIPLS